MNENGIYLKAMLVEKTNRETGKKTEMENHYFVFFGDDEDVPKVCRVQLEVGVFKANLGDKVSFKQKVKEWDGRPYVAYSNLKLAK